MRYTDVAIVGGGLAGSTAAAMLGRAAIPFPLDPSRVTHERALDTRAPRKCAPLFETQRGNESKKTHAGTFRGAIA